MPSPLKSRPDSQGASKVHEIIYILFKHKWKIIVLSLLGFGAAGVLAYRASLKPSYETQAKLLVRYVVERSTNDPDAASTTGRRGGGVMNTELEILKSFDIAINTASAIGPEKILTGRAIPPSATEAGAAIYSKMLIQSQRDSNVIQLSCRDTDPKRAIEILNQYMQSYFARHLEIHRSTSAFDQVTDQTNQARSALRTTEDEINRLKSESGVISIAGTIDEFESRRQLIRGNLLAAQQSLAEQKARVEALGNSPPPPESKEKADVADAPPTATTPESDDKRRETAEALAEYQDLSARLGLIKQERNRVLLRRSPSDAAVVSMNRQVQDVQARLLDLGQEHPELFQHAQTAGREGAPAVVSFEDEKALLKAMQARYDTTVAQGKEIENEVEGLSALGFKLEELERRRQMEEEKYRYSQSSLEKARVDETLDPSKIPNISIVQSPSSPVKSLDSQTTKIMMGVAAAGVILGLAFAFLKEMVLDRRVFRPLDIQYRLQLPLMLSIPYVRSKDGIAKLIGSLDSLSPPPIPERGLLVNGNSDEVIPESIKPHFIESFAAAIHDRIIFNFEINNITHKPKLIALTGLSEKAGTSTIATGLAKAFADNGNRKVLLVDLNPPQDRLPLSGNPTESLRRAVEISKSDQFRMTPQSLYFASAKTRRERDGSASLAPVALREILPSLIASDFDYILFDMPTVDATSPTFAMAGIMDKVLLILDAENTTPERLKQAYSDLERGRADVSCIFNKVRSHAPRWVEGAI